MDKAKARARLLLLEDEIDIDIVIKSNDDTIKLPVSLLPKNDINYLVWRSKCSDKIGGRKREYTIKTPEGKKNVVDIIEKGYVPNENVLSKVVNDKVIYYYKDYNGTEIGNFNKKHNAIVSASKYRAILLRKIKHNWFKADYVNYIKENKAQVLQAYKNGLFSIITLIQIFDDIKEKIPAELIPEPEYNSGQKVIIKMPDFPAIDKNKGIVKKHEFNKDFGMYVYYVEIESFNQNFELFSNYIKKN
ncbi:MAG: hypothetical protein WCT85_00790 [Parachlamydiales bacterium]|jgi:hypothetical protein